MSAMRSSIAALAAAGARRLPLRVRLWLYRLGPLTDWLRQALNRSVPAGVHPVKVAAGDLAGCWLILDLQVDKDLWLGNYEPDVAAAIRHSVPQGGTAYDVGANVGYTTLLLARAIGPEGLVFAFEPLAENLDRLRQAVRLNQLESRVRVVPVAVGARPGPGAFRIHTSGGMGRLAQDVGRQEGFLSEVTVEAVSLDAFVYDDHHPAPHLIKIDIEGGEGAALQGMRRLLQTQRPRLLIEIHGSQAPVVSRALQAASYRIHSLAKGYPVIVSGSGDGLPKHVLAVPEEAEA